MTAKPGCGAAGSGRCKSSRASEKAKPVRVQPYPLTGLAIQVQTEVRVMSERLFLTGRSPGTVRPTARLDNPTRRAAPPPQTDYCTGSATRGAFCGAGRADGERRVNFMVPSLMLPKRKVTTSLR